MRIDWVMLIAAVAVFVIALVLQWFVQMQVKLQTCADIGMRVRAIVANWCAKMSAE
jgi:hypothetical protein